MAAYHADDIRNLKKMIGFIEDHTVSIEEEKLIRGRGYPPCAVYAISEIL